MPLLAVAKKLPWQVLFQAVYGFRRFVFSKDPTPVDHLIVPDVDPETLQRLLLQEGLVKGDSASYHYYDEDLNMVMGMYKPDEYEWYQYHVRGFDVEEGTRLRPHTELYWRMFPREHINLVNLDVQEGIEVTRELLEHNDVAYEVVDVDGSRRRSASRSGQRDRRRAGRTDESLHP